MLVVDDVTETRENLKKLLYFEDDIEVVGTGSSGREGVEQAAALRPDLVLMDINMPGMDGITASELISSTNPDVQVIMMSVQGESDYLRRSMLAGAREFLIKPFSSEELATSIRRVYQLAVTRRAMAPPAPAPQAVSEAPLPRAKPQGPKVIAVYSPKGGCGVTTIAVNLAIALHEETQQQVALFDASFQFGDVGVMLNLPTHRSMADIVGTKHEPDEDVLNGVLATHSSGIRVLLAPPRPELAELITPEHIRAVFAILIKSCDYIVVDTAKSINDVLLTILDAAEQIILVSTADIGSLKNAKLFFEVTEALKYPASKTILLLNKYDGRGGINARDIEGNIKHSVVGSVPRDDRATSAALNRGVPFVISQKSAGVSQALFALARIVRRPPEPATIVVRAEAPRSSSQAVEKPKRKRGGFFFFWRS